MALAGSVGMYSCTLESNNVDLGLAANIIRIGDRLYTGMRYSNLLLYCTVIAC